MTLQFEIPAPLSLKTFKVILNENFVRQTYEDDLPQNFELLKQPDESEMAAELFVLLE